ncbi:MAG: elongation factor P [Thermoleophilia bacterium]|nr:elongation factor P [Thermoleophilia bacterium]
MADVVDTAQFKNGLHIKLDGHVWRIVFFQHHKPGKGGAVMRTKLKNLTTGSTVDKTFRAGEKFPRVHTEQKTAQFLYADGDDYIFMDPVNFDQMTLSAATVDESAKFLQDNMTVQLFYLDGEPAGVELPTTIEMRVAATEPAVRGDTVGNVQKPATLENGAVIQVPSFVAEGDLLKVDTREGGRYVSRV